MLIACVAVTLKFAHTPELQVIRPVPELVSIITLSKTVGAEAPPPPPELEDQLVVVDVSQVPVPPTQYLRAISNQ
jgi:hypothetical protein